MTKPELFFPRDTDFYDWLLSNHNTSKGIYVIFYKLELNVPTMRWEEAVKVALCFGWMQGYKLINLAKKTGTWTAMDDVENGVIPEDLKAAFDRNPVAFENYQNFSRGYRKSYLSWLHSGKREATRQKRIIEIIKLCKANIKSRDTW